MSVFVQPTLVKLHHPRGTCPLHVHFLYDICHMHFGVWTRKEGWVTSVASRPLQIVFL